MENILSRDQLIEKIVYFGDDTDYKIISNLIESPEPIYSDEDSKSEHDSNSDMDVDQEFKNENKISKQEKKDRQIFVQRFHQSSKYSNSSQMYKSRKLSWSERKIRYILNHYKLYNDFPEDNRSQSQNRSSNKLEEEQITFIINKLEEDSTLSSKEISNLIKLEFDLDVGKTTILKCLKSNGYSYKHPKLKIKNEEQQRKMRENWWLRHMQNTNFYDIFFTDETSFYLDNPVGARWLKDHDNLIFSKKKGRKIGAWAAINANGKTSLYLYEMNFNTENYLKVLEEAVEEMKEITSSETLYLQMDNARYHWTTEALEFYLEKNIKVIDWPPYSPDLNSIENIWAIMKQKLEGRKFATMTSSKNELYNIWRILEERLVKKTCISIYDRINDCLNAEVGLTNY